jgi:hypothetical protein
MANAAVGAAGAQEMRRAAAQAGITNPTGAGGQLAPVSTTKATLLGQA